MNPLEIIEKKQKNNPLDEEEINFFINSYLKGKIPDYQMAALLMAIYFAGMDFNETFYLTKTFLNSGITLDFPEIGIPKVDKHSTGGVGDKVSILLAPMVASCGVCVPMISGRGLGHTGGTLDKLESIEGYRVDLSTLEMEKSLRDCGYFISGTTEEIVPADRKIYELRDATSTVSSMPLIISSILSKKIAEGIDALVMDVKCGSGGFLKDINEAKILSRGLIEVSEKFNLKTNCIISNMDFPLGEFVGNSLEVLEVIEILKGNLKNDVLELTLVLGSHMLFLAGISESLKDGKKILMDSLNGGKAYECFLKNLRSQGANFPLNIKVSDKFLYVKSFGEGFLKFQDVSLIGRALQYLGGGRFKKGEKIDHTVGIQILKKRGEMVKRGDNLFKVFYSKKSNVKMAIDLLDKSYKLVDSKFEENLILLEIMGDKDA